MRISREQIYKLLSEARTNLEIAARLGCAEQCYRLETKLGFPVLPWGGSHGRAKTEKPRVVKEKPVLVIVNIQPDPAPEPKPRYARSPCPWPLGDVKPFTSCGAKTLHGRVYCEDHCRKAYAVLTPGKRILV